MKNLFTRFQKLLFIVLLFPFTYSTAQTIIPAEIGVSYDVTQSGAFTYSVPLEMPPGIKDMVPGLAISYNSQGGNGNMGIGWSLSGLSAITRSGTTIYHHDMLDPVDFDANDVFMLDGQRLFPMGSDIYMTENKNFAIIKSFGSAGNGPAYFTVEYPNGMIYEYGNTTASKMVAQGKSDILTWGVNRISDQNGNYITFDYYNDQGNGQFFPLSITYGFNANVANATVHTIELHHLHKPDATKAWVAGSLVHTHVFLDRIDIKQDGTLVNQYEFTYDHQLSGGTLDYMTHLVQIDQKLPNNIQLPPIKINWGKKDQQYSTPQDSYIEADLGAPTGYYDDFIVGDFNADGATDITALTAVTNNGSYYVNLNTKTINTDQDFLHASTGSVHYSLSGSSIWTRKGRAFRRFFFDYNADGMDDMFLVFKDFSNSSAPRLVIEYYQSDGTGLSYHSVLYDQSITEPDWADLTKITPGDYDGNGKMELLIAQPSTYGGTVPHRWVTSYDLYLVGADFPTNNGVPQASNFIANIFGNTLSDFAMDFDGDGKDEYCRVNGLPGSLADFAVLTFHFTYTPAVALNGANNYTVLYSHNANYYDQAIYPADFNGDGKSDILSYNAANSTWQFRMSTGTGVDVVSLPPVLAANIHPTGPVSNRVYQTADFNGDGTTDILELSDILGNKTYKIFYAWGYNNYTYETGTLPATFNMNNIQSGDFNGDGQVDLLTIHVDNSTIPATSTPYILYFHPNDIRHQVSSVEHAGKRLDIEMKTLASADADVDVNDMDGDHYGFSPWAVNGHTQTEYPYLSKQIAMKVVTRLEDNISMNRGYYYQTLSMHLTGLGMIGFEKVCTRDFTNSKLIDNRYSMFPFWGTAGDYSITNFLVETNIYSIYDPNTPLKNIKYCYRDKAGDAIHGKVRIIKQNDVLETDYGTGVNRDAYTMYDVNSSMFFNFGTPEFIQVQTGVRNGYNMEVTNFTYDTTLPFINRHKPVSVTKTSTYSAEPSYSRTTNYKYDGFGQLEEETTDPATSNRNITEYTYDVWGNVLSTTITGTAPGGVSITRTKDLEYSADGRFVVKSIKYNGADQYIDRYNYDGWGNVIYHKENLLETFREYDAIGRLVKTIHPEDVITRNAYGWAYNSSDDPNTSFVNYQTITPNHNNAQFFVKSWTDGSQAEALEYIDFYGKPLRKAYSAFNGSKTYEDTWYWGNGNVKGTTLPYTQGTSPEYTEYYYNDHNQEIYRQSSTGPSYTTVYTTSINPSKLKIEVTNDQTGQVKTTQSDAGGVFHVEDNGNTIEYYRHSNGKPNFIRVNNDVNLTTTYTYDNFGRLLSLTEPNAGTTSYIYNSFGEVLRETLPSGLAKGYTYNGLGQVITRQEGSTTYSYQYYTPASPAAGKIKQEKVSNSFGVGSHDYVYDAYGRLYQLTEKPDANKTFVTEYSYDGLGRVGTQKYPSSITVTYGYNAYGYLENVSLPGQKLWQVNSKNALGSVINAFYYKPSGQPSYEIDRAYSPLGFPETRKVTCYNSTVTAWEDYLFDEYTGNLTWREDKMHNLREDFTYDIFDRLTNVSSNTTVPPLQMTYNAAGNILKKTDLGSDTYLWQYDKYALKTLPDVNSQGGVPLADVRQPMTQNVSYHQFNKVYEINEGADKVQFYYGPDDQRNKAEFNPGLPGSKLRYYATNYEETIENGITTKVSYIWGDGEPIAIIYDVQGTSSIYYLATDYLGSITHVLNTTFGPNTTIIEERSFDAWGRWRDPATWQYTTTPGQSPGWIIDRGYTGHEHIFSNGYDFSVINMNGRLYDPLVGRMFSLDPVVFNGSTAQLYNKYTYAANNPLKFTDPDGEWIHIAIGAVVGGVINWATHGAKFDAKGLGYFGVGALAGALTAATGGAVVGVIGFGGIAGGAVVGTATGFAGGFVNNAGNAYLNGANLGEGLSAGLSGGIKGAITGAVLGGVTGGVSAAIRGRNILNGRHTETALRKMGVKLTGDRVPREKLQEFYKEKFPGADNFRHGRPGLRISGMKTGIKWAKTIPDSYTRASGSTIYIKNAALSSDKQLFYTLDHELAHAQWFDDGTFAMLNQFYGHNNAVELSEINAYQSGVSLARSWGDQVLEQWSRMNIGTAISNLFR